MFDVYLLTFGLLCGLFALILFVLAIGFPTSLVVYCVLHLVGFCLWTSLLLQVCCLETLLRFAGLTLAMGCWLIVLTFWFLDLGCGLFWTALLSMIGGFNGLPLICWLYKCVRVLMVVLFGFTCYFFVVCVC